MNPLERSLQWFEVANKVQKIREASDQYRHNMEWQQPDKEGVTFFLGCAGETKLRFFLSFSSMKSHCIDGIHRSMYKGYMVFSSRPEPVRDAVIGLDGVSAYYRDSQKILVMTNDTKTFLDNFSSEECTSMITNSEEMSFQKGMLVSESTLLSWGFLSLLSCNMYPKHVNLRLPYDESEEQDLILKTILTGLDSVYLDVKTGIYLDD